MSSRRPSFFTPDWSFVKTLLQATFLYGMAALFAIFPLPVLVATVYDSSKPHTMQAALSIIFVFLIVMLCIIATKLARDYIRS